LSGEQVLETGLKGSPGDSCDAGLQPKSQKKKKKKKKAV
jgi:hypothetical protein